MNDQIKAKVEETFRQMLKDLNIPYDPYSSATDDRAVIIYNGLSWIANYVDELH